MTTINPTNYTLLKKQAASLIEDEHHMIAILSNMSALLNDNLDQINWVGFYLLEQNELILGPFQGHPACGPHSNWKRCMWYSRFRTSYTSCS
ncbi:GAF domain protein [Staphylococcus aureus]|uniref:GAF domain protein n=1 Tax=Staphylococcus aureus TaxID=1280 RepID=A0A380E517_STAAU|nr:GAF domain protein [Staphylococcus aureus]